MNSPVVTRYDVAKRRNEFDEWVVRAWLADGKRYTAADAFEGSKADAEATADALNTDIARRTSYAASMAATYCNEYSI